MNAQEFIQTYKVPNSFKSTNYFDKWKQEKEIDGLLGSMVAGGVTLGEVLSNDDLSDQISQELYDGFKSLMGDKINSYEDIRDILVEKMEIGDRSVLGLVNKIKGQIGENAFIQEAHQLGVNAKLAESGSQEAWDVAIDRGGETQFVQVKLYSDADNVIQHIEKVNQKIAESVLFYEGTSIEQIDFAVPQEIFQEVQEKVIEKGLNTEILPFNMSASEGAEIVMDGFENISEEGLEELFEQLLGSAMPASFALHGLINAFLVYKGAKEADEYLSDTALQASISTMASGTGLAVDALLHKLSWIGGVPTAILVTTTSMASRAIIKRVVNRNEYVGFGINDLKASREIRHSIPNF